MEKNYHFIQQRLENLKAIKPMLMSLRTISLSSWRLSLKKIENLKAYRQEIDSIAEQVGVLPVAQANPENPKSCLIILGSTRGLCGGFNRDLFTAYKEHASELDQTTEILLFGEKIGKTFSSQHTAYHQVLDYPKINQVNFQFINRLFSTLLSDNPLCRILYNQYQGSGRYTAVLRTIPVSQSTNFKAVDHRSDLIIDTDPQILADYLFHESNLLGIYESFLSSLAAEHSFRFQIMENAITNTDDLIQELGLMVQVERQRKITSEMRELSISAGLLDG
jgi:F-type H+-transporting ATPase subunit gamma